MKSVMAILVMVLVAAGCKTGGGKAAPVTPPPAEPSPLDAGAPPDAAPASAAESVADKPGEKKAEAKPKPAPHTVDGRKLVLVGAGARVVDGQKLYDIQIWIDDQDGRRAFPALAMRAGGRDHARLVRGDHAPAFLVWGRFTKQAVLTFAREVPAATIRADLQGALDAVKGADALLALVGDAAAGDQWLLTTRDNGEIELSVGGDTRQAPQSPRLSRALWKVWLGARPLSVELRRQLVDKIDTLR